MDVPIDHTTYLIEHGEHLLADALVGEAQRDDSLTKERGAQLIIEGIVKVTVDLDREVRRREDEVNDEWTDMNDQRSSSAAVAPRRSARARLRRGLDAKP